MTQKIKVAILGSGNIGTDLMIKVMRHSDVLEMGALVGIDPESDGLARAKRLKVATTHEGLDGLTKMDIWKDIQIVFDATSAGAHKPELSPRELAVRFTDTQGYFVSESSVYRLLKAHDLISSPAFIVMKAGQ